MKRLRPILAGLLAVLIGTMPVVEAVGMSGVQTPSAATMVASAAEPGATSDSSAATSETTPSATLSESGSITVGISAQSKPFNYYTEDGKLTGFEVELLEEIDRRLEDVQFEYKTTEFASLFAGLDAGTFDLIINNIGEKTERREKHLFSLYPYAVVHNVLITRPEEGENVTLADLAGKKMGVVAGSTQALFMEKYNSENPDKTVRLEYIDADGPTIIREVDSGRIDATIYATTYLVDVENTFGIDLMGSPIENEDAIQPPGAYILYRKDEASVAFRNQVDEILSQLRENGFLTELSTKYFGQDYSVLTQDIIDKNDGIEAERMQAAGNAAAGTATGTDGAGTAGTDAADAQGDNATGAAASSTSNANATGTTASSTNGKIFAPSVILQDIPIILRELPVTLVMTLVSALIGLILGFLLALIKLRKIPVLNQLARLFVSFMRGTPQLVQLFLAFYGFPLVVRWLGERFGFAANVNDIPALVYVFIAFGLNEAAYTSEIFRSAILSVDKAEIEAAKSIGLTNFQTIWRIILPSAMLVALPNLGNSLISLLKASSLAFTVTVVDIMGRARVLAGGNLRFFEAYIAVALIYWVICLIIEFTFGGLEKKLNVDEKAVVQSNLTLEK